MTLYEVWYHDPWRSTASYGRQTIQTSVEALTDWLMSHKSEWYDEDETPIDYVVDQAIDKEFTYMTVTTIVIDDNGHVTYDSR